MFIFGENQRRRSRWGWGEVAAEELGEKGREIFGWDVKRINKQNKTLSGQTLGSVHTAKFRFNCAP